jgi:hypothetical protein
VDVTTSNTFNTLSISRWTALNGTIDALIYLDTGSTGGEDVGVIARATTAGDYYLVDVVRNQEVNLHYITGNGVGNTFLASTSGTWPLNQWARLTFRVQGEKLSIAVNDKTIIQITSTDLLDAGGWGLFAYTSDTATTVQWVEVQRQ